MNKPTATSAPATATFRPQITLGDLDKTLTVEQALKLVDHIISVTRDNIEANIEHWTDDEGLHWSPFHQDLDKELPVIADREAYIFLSDAQVI